MQCPGATKTSMQRDISSFDGRFSNGRYYHPSPRSLSSLLDELSSKSIQKTKYSPSKPHQELKDLYQKDQDEKSKFGVERTSEKNLYQSPAVKASLSEYAASSSKEDILRSEDLRKEHQKASKLEEEEAERLKVLRSLKKEAEDDLFDLVSMKTSISRRTSTRKKNRALLASPCFVNLFELQIEPLMITD
ncbi:hypothetical protein BY996DRAFT_6535095 [Phakopsora pachyrhizi]|nr:hypothetical protein BY996DRAFT_6535095 [Phakopsora pachyrhizi]